MSESDTSITSEVLLSPRLLDCTEDRERALPCLALPCKQMTPMAPVDTGMVRTRSRPLVPGAAQADQQEGAHRKVLQLKYHCCWCPPHTALGPEGTSGEAG